MNKKRAIRLLGGAAATVVAVGSALVVSTMAQGFESPSLSSATSLPVHSAETRILIAQADAAPEMAPVSYSSDQADAGEKTFNKNCEDCHGDDLRGGLLGGPPLRGLAFESKYSNGSPAGVLFEVMSTTMPPNSPGSFSASTYADLMAYILKRNGFPAGAPLPEDIDALYNLTIDK